MNERANKENPNAITGYSEWPNGVLNAVFHLMPSNVRENDHLLQEAEFERQQEFIFDGDVV